MSGRLEEEAAEAEASAEASLMRPTSKWAAATRAAATRVVLTRAVLTRAVPLVPVAGIEQLARAAESDPVAGIVELLGRHLEVWLLVMPIPEEHLEFEA